MHPSAVTSISTGKNYSYNPNGNMITAGPPGSQRTLAWDVENRLDSINVPGIGTTSFDYDYTGARVIKNVPGAITTYPFQGYEVAPNNEITKFIRIGIETFASKKGTTKYFYHNDHLGGVNVITDINGARVQLNEYDPWGKVSRSEPATNPPDPTHRFNGKELDPESGLYYYGGRYYDPELSRFVSPDPFVPRPEDPQSLNRYSYVINNPQNYVDPTGHFFGKLFKGIFGKIAKHVIAVLAPGLYLRSLIPQPPQNVSAGFNIFMGSLMLLSGNPAGAFFIASGALSFGKGQGFQIASQVLGFAGMAAALGGGSQGDSGISPVLGLIGSGGGGEELQEGPIQVACIPCRLADWATKAGPQIQRLSPYLEAIRRNLVGAQREIHVLQTYFGNRSEVLRRVQIPGGEVDIYDPIRKIAAEVGGPMKGASDRLLREFGLQLDRLVTFAQSQGGTAKVFLEQATTSRGAIYLERAGAVAAEKVGAENVVIFSR